MRRSLTFLAIFLAAGGLAAHDLYLMPAQFHVEKGQRITVALHNGDAFPESEATAPIERLRDALLRSKNAQPTVTGFHDDGKRTLGTVVIPGNGELLLSVRTEPNFIGLSPADFTKYLQEEGLAEVISWREAHGESSKPGRERYSKYAKAILLADRPNGEYERTAGFPIEILLERDPYLLEPGDTLPVRVIFRGEAAAGLQLEVSWVAADGAKKTEIVGRTNREGHVAFKLASAGRYRLHVLKMERCSEPAAADWESFWASLTFEIPSQS